MYVLECDKKFNSKLSIPDISLRYSNIFHSDKINVVIIKEQFNDPTFRYRGYNIIQSMEENKRYNLNCFRVNELNVLYDLLDKIDLVILQRAIWSFELESFVNTLKNNNINVIYDIDDLIYNTKYVPKYINSIGDFREVTINQFFSASKRHELIAEMCDGFIVTTKNLQKHIKQDFNKPVWIFHNYFNLEQEKVSKEIVDLKKNSYLSDKFIIGYFSGSNSHKRDLEIVEPALLKLFKKYDNIYLMIAGPMILSSEFKKLKREGRILISDFVPYEQLQYEIAKVDLNIIPLQKHGFNECKSELKYFEASIVNTLSCATDNEVYNDIIEDGVNGFLADELSWFEKLEYIYLNYSNLKEVIDNARIKCLNEYSSKKQESGIEAMYDDIMNTLM